MSSLTNFVVTFRNRIIIGAVASLFIVTLGLLKSLKSASQQPPQTENNSNNNNSTSVDQQPITANKQLRVSSKGLNDPKQQSNTQIIDFDPIQLPHHILFQIFQLVPPSQFLRCTQVSKKWKSIIDKLDKVWIFYSKSHWGLTTVPESESYFEFFKNTYIEEKKRLGFTPEKYIITIMEQSAEFTDPARWASERIFQTELWWKNRFLEEMNSTLKHTRLVVNNKNNNRNNNNSNNNNNNNNILNNSNNNNNNILTKSNSFDNEDNLNENVIIGSIYFTQSNSPIGTFRFIDTKDAQNKFRNQKWLAKAYIGEESPYTGDVVGYFNFTLFGLDCPEEVFGKYKPSIQEFLKTLTYQSRGTLTRLDTGYTVQSVLFEDCKLSAVFGKYGFNDGDALLDTDNNSAYIASLIETIQKFLDKKGVGYNSIEDGAKVNYTGQTSHNPIRYSGHLPKEALQWEIGLWIYNTVILNSKRLWGRRLEDD